jgi:ribosomal protein L44E
MDKIEWLLCPVCRNKTRIKLRENTTLLNFPLFCPKCKQETTVNVEELKLSVIKEPEIMAKS